ncbi:MAG: Zn-dependent alcohol dehydrogenase, partial [Propionibacterium sp.]
MQQDEMWAVQYGSYGGPEVLTIGSTPKPKVGRGEVLVEVSGFSLNNVDVEKRRGKMKGVNGFGFPKGIGVDFAGVVADVGEGANRWRIGDRVWGYLGIKPCGESGAAAQYVAVRPNKIAHAPTNISIQEAAAFPLAGLTALQALRDTLKVEPGQRTLVVGGSGGVGSTAVQVAAALGAEVDAVVGSQASVATKAGANRIFDYHSVTPDDIAERYDAIL